MVRSIKEKNVSWIRLVAKVIASVCHSYKVRMVHVSHPLQCWDVVMEDVTTTPMYDQWWSECSYVISWDCFIGCGTMWSWCGMFAQLHLWCRIHCAQHRCWLCIHCHSRYHWCSFLMDDEFDLSVMCRRMWWWCAWRLRGMWIASVRCSLSSQLYLWWCLCGKWKRYQQWWWICESSWEIDVMNREMHATQSLWWWSIGFWWGMW